MTAPRHALRVIKKSARIALRRSPVRKVGSKVRRRVITVSASGRDTLVDSVFMPAAHGSAARVRYAGVLDGHTLNLHAVLPDGAADTAVPASLVFVNGEQRVRAEARLHRDGGGRLCASATVLLGADIGGLPVTAGRWRLALELAASPATTRLRLLGDGSPAFAGPTRARTTCPRTGRRHRLGISPSGQLRLTVAPPRPRAEVLRIEHSFTGASVLFATYGPTGQGPGDSGPEPVVELVEQERRLVRRHAAEPLPGDDGAWRVTVPLATMLDTSARQVWSFRLPRPSGGRPLDIGLREHDLRAPRRVLTPPRFTVRAADGTFVVVKPQYTRRGTLQLVCTPRETSAR
ncbi:putative hypothetical protein [Streptomyces sp. NBRC 110611]|uniref:hypothetical protein n=1 Tax=Streptomyces sp. NBRC 110611 TaxID=1621259 RepID=UPI0008555398|nr:hypothetical protein [Streptomyces sp. NBRC 110611]GAU70543.1 putative hypothetical protein [Streptomyces sp. NBRC 110611]